MSFKGDKSLIVGLDIGTSKVVALVGEYAPGQPIELIGLGTHDSRGMRRGVIVDIESTVQSIQEAIKEAEASAGCEITSVYASISGSHIQCRNSQGITPIHDQEVTHRELQRVIEAAKAVPIGTDLKIIHAIPRDYTLDDTQEGIRNPLGMTGVRLEVNAHIVTAANSAAANITRCVEKCGLSVDELIFSVVASAEAVLTSDERDLGVLMVDLGAGTTDIAVFVNGAIAYSKSLPIAGEKVTEDIAHMLRTPTSEAEQIKVRYACAQASMAKAEETIQVPSVGDRQPRRVQRAALAQAVQARYEEIFEMVQAELRRSGFEQHVRAGMVMTGGASRMEGLADLAEEMLQMPVRVGIPQHATGNPVVMGNPVYSTAVGLLLLGAKNDAMPASRSGRRSSSGGDGMFDRMKNWFQGNF